MKKLLIVGSNSVHIKTYLKLIEGYFDDILFLTHLNRKPFPENCNVQTVNFSLTNPINIFKSVQKIKNHIRNFNPSVIHIHQANSFSFLTLLANKKNQKPTVVSAWGSDILLLPKMGYLYKKMSSYILNNANLYTADSQHVINEMLKITEKRIYVQNINFGVDICHFDTNHKKENIIYSNRLHNSLYRIDKIIEAFSDFVKSQTEWQLVIAGTGDETASLKTLVKKFNMEKNVLFLGWVDADMNIDYYKKSRFFVSIPESDGTSISLLEAMAYGCIPVVSNLPSNKEWIDNGINGIVVNDTNSTFFKDVFNIDEKRAIQLNTEIIKKKGTKKANREKFIDCYNKLINNGQH